MMIEPIFIAPEHRSFWLFRILAGLTLYEEYVKLFNRVLAYYREVARLVLVDRRQAELIEGELSRARAEADRLLDPRTAFVDGLGAQNGPNGLLTIMRTLTELVTPNYPHFIKRSKSIRQAIERFNHKLRRIVNERRRQVSYRPS